MYTIGYLYPSNVNFDLDNIYKSSHHLLGCEDFAPTVTHASLSFLGMHTRHYQRSIVYASEFIGNTYKFTASSDSHFVGWVCRMISKS